MMTVPPAGMVGAATAHERRASPSALGEELSDDSLTMSPEEKQTKKRGSHARPISGKRLALSLPRPTRRESPSAREGRERSPRARGPKSVEERLAAIELQNVYDRKVFKDDLDGLTKISLELRREVFGSRAATADAMTAIEGKFRAIEGQLENKIANMDFQMAALQRTLEQAQAQLPMDGRVVQETFASISAEIATLKAKQGETFTKEMVTELELMQRRVADHEAHIQTLSGANGHFNLLIENLGFAYARLADTVEKCLEPPDGASIPEARSDWQRPARRTAGLQGEQFYGGPGGYPGNVGGRSGGLGLAGAWGQGGCEGHPGGGFGGCG